MANLIPYTKSSITKPKKSAIIKADKFLNAKSTKVNANSVKPKQSKNSSEDIILQIEKKVIKIDKLLKDSFALKKKQQKKVRIKGEQKEFEDREKELEKKKPKKEKGVNLPTPPKMGFLDWIKNFVFNTILGFLAVRLIKFLPTLLKIYPVIIGAGEFLINVGGSLLNSLVSFVDWGYKAVDATSGFIKSIGGEGLSKVFDNFMGAIDNVLEFAVMAALVSSGGDESDSGGLGGKGGRRGFDSQGRRVGKNVQQRYSRRFGKDKFVDRFGTKNLKNVAQGAGRGGLQQGARNAFVGVAGKGGAKSILKFIRPLTNKLPIIGGLLNFGLSVALGEDPGRAAFKAIGSTLVGALGAAIGSLAFGVGGIIGGIIGGIGGDALGGVLYDMFFNNKKPKPKQGKTNKLAGGGRPVPTARGRKPVTRTLKKKKSTRTLTFTPRKIQPGRSAGGEAKVQSVFPNPEKAWWDPLGVFTGKKQEQQPQQKKPKGKSANPQEFLIKSNDIFGRAKGTAGKMISGFATYIIKSLLGDVPDDLDYLNLSKGLNSFMQGIFQPGTLAFAGGGEVDARQFFEGKDYTKVIAKSVKESGSKEVDTIIRNLKNEMSLRPVGRDEMLQENIRRGTEGTEGEDGEGGGLTPGQWGPMLDLISSGEGGYSSVNPSLVRPGILDMNLQQLLSFKAQSKRTNGGSAALGRYQFINPELAYNLAGINPKEKFTKENQDKMAVAYLEKKRPGKEWLAGKISTRQYIEELSNEWGAFRSYSGNVLPGNSGKIGPEKIESALNKVKKGGYSKQEIDVSKESKEQMRPTGKFKVIEYITGDRNHPNLDVRGHGLPSNYHDHIAFSTISEKENAKRALRAANINIGSEYRPGDRGYHGSNLAIDVPGAQWGGRGAIGQKEFDGSKRVRQVLGIGINAPRFHGGPILKTGDFFGHKGEYVIDADSVELFGDIIPDINSIENKSQLIEKAPSIIEKLKQISGISGYADYENPNQEPQYIFIQSPPEIVYVPTGSGGSPNILISGGIDKNDSIRQTLCQMA